MMRTDRDCRITYEATLLCGNMMNCFFPGKNENSRKKRQKGKWHGDIEFSHL
jgi:hypothetical protein